MLSAAILVLGGALAAGRGTAHAKQPTLVVLVVIDQLRADLLDRYDRAFTGGFRRLRDSGFRFTKATVNHAITVSHPGHVTIATGMHPSHHGIVDGAWTEWHDGRWRLVDPVLDSSTRIVGFPALVGASPRRLLVTALPEWFRDADTASRSVAIGLGQYSSILHAGRSPGDVYWFDARVGRFVTSTYFRADDPAWVRRFHDEDLPTLRKDTVWERTAPQWARALALPDTAAYEADGANTWFPHRFRSEVPQARRADPLALIRWQIGNTPFLDGATLRLGERAIESLRLGQRSHTDYLSIVLSETDEIGHWYGPLSQEQLENLLNLDRILGDFLKYLDGAVGADNYVLALTADHGVADLPEAPSAMWPRRRRLEPTVVEALFDSIQTFAHPQGLVFDSTMARAVADFVRRQDFVADAFTVSDMSIPNPIDSFRLLYQRSFNRARVMRLPLFSARRELTLGTFGVMARLVEGTVPRFDPGVHLSPYMYDRSVPLMFIGHGVPRGLSSTPVGTVDVAPTIAALAGIPVPPHLDGRAMKLTPR